MFSITKPRVPEGLRDLMKDLTKEILKEKPTDIYNFAEHYFLSRLPEKEHYKVKKFEDNSVKYDFSYIQNSQRYQIPVALVYSIIPETLTNLIKDLIKAILREQPENLCDFAVEYFRHLKATIKKTANPTENITKEINYSAYENYFNNKERFLLTPYVKCKCGRILGESEDTNYDVIQNDDKKDKNKDRRDFTFTAKYLNSVILIQQNFRRYLKTRNTKTNTNETPKDSAITEQLNQTSNQSKINIPQLHLNQVETENVSEDASYTSASTVQLSASESGRDNSDLSTTESIPTKTIIEREEIENNEINLPTHPKGIVINSTTHQSRSNRTTDDDSKSTLNSKKLNTEEGDAHKLAGVESNKPRNLDINRKIKREKSIENNKEEPSGIEHFFSNTDSILINDNSSVTDDHKEINSELFDTKIYSNEGENNENEIINASLQTKEKHLESMHKVSMTENMNSGSENIKKTADGQHENSSTETNVVLSESESVEIPHESNKPQTHTKNSDKDFDDNPKNLKSDRENVQNVLPLLVNEQNIQTTDVSTDKISCDESENTSDFNPNHEISEHMDTNKESRILGENQNNLSKLHEGNNSFNAQDTTSPIINDEEDKTSNDVNHEKNSNMLNKVKSNDNYSDREIEINTISKAHKSEFNSPNVNKNDNSPTSSIADLLPENHQIGSIVKDSNSSEIISKCDNTITNIENIALDSSTDSEKFKVVEDLEMKENIENSFAKTKTELYETDVIAKPGAEITVERTLDKNEMESVIVEDQKNRKFEDTFDEHGDIGQPEENKTINDAIPNESHSQHSFETNSNQDLTDEGKYKLKTELKSPKDNNKIIDLEKGNYFESSEFESKQEKDKIITKQNDESVLITKNNIETKNESIQHESPYTTFDELKPTGNVMNKNVEGETENDKISKIGEKTCDNKSEEKEETLNQNNDIKEEITIIKDQNNSNSSVNEKIVSEKTKEQSQPNPLNTEIYSNKSVDDTDANAILKKNFSEASLSQAKEDQSNANKSKQNLDQNIVMEKGEGASDINEHDLKESVNEMITYENIRNDTTDNTKSEINCDETVEVRNVKNLASTENYVINDTVPHDIAAADQISTVLQINCKEEQNDKSKPEQSIDQIIVTEERKSSEKENQSDADKLNENRDVEKEGMTIEMINSKNSTSDVTDEQTSTTQTHPGYGYNTEQRIHQNEKEIQSNENKSDQNQDIEKEETATEKINSDDIRSDVSDNFETRQKFKFNVVDSVGNDTIPANVIAGDQSNTTLQTRPSEENKPEQSIDQNIGMEERKSSEKENQSDADKLNENRDVEKEGMTIEMINSKNSTSDVTDEQTSTTQTHPGNGYNTEQRIHQNEKEIQSNENKSDQNQDIKKEGTATEKINSDDIRSDVSDNLETRQKFKFNVVDSVGNDTIPANVIAGDQSNKTSQARPNEENKPEQSIDQNIGMEERKSSEKESQIYDTEKEKINSENIIGDVSDNSDTRQKLKLNTVDSIRNNILCDTISNNITADNQTGTSRTKASDKTKPEQSIDQNEKENQSIENKSSQNVDIEKAGTTTEKADSENPRSGATDNLNIEQKFKLNVVDSVGNDTISDNITAGAQSNTTLQTRPSEENKPEQSRDKNIALKERKSNEKESQSDENKSSQNKDTERDGSATEKINSENKIRDVRDNSKTGQKFKFNVVDSVGNDTIPANIIAGDQSNTTSQARPNEENKPEQSIDQNIGMEERKSIDKESKSDENKSSQNNDTEEEGSATEKINSENITGDAIDNLETGLKHKLNVVDSVGNDTISDNIIAGNQSNTTLQISPSEENKPEQSMNQNIGMEGRKSNEKESQSDENESNENNDIEKEGSATEKINTDKIIGDVSDNSKPGQKFKLDVVDSVGNDTISDNIIAGDQSNTTLQIRPSEENKPEQSMNQNIAMKERKSNGKESQSDESNENYDIAKEGSATEKINTVKIIGDVSDNSKPGQTFKLDIVDSVGNDTISDNIIAGIQSNTTLQISPSEENKPEQSMNQNIGMEGRKSNEKESQSDENESNENNDIEKEGSATEKINTDKIIGDVSDNSKPGQKFKLDVVDSVGNDTISDNIIAGDQSNTTLQIRPSEENKPEQSMNQNIAMKERKSNGKESQSDESNENYDIAKEGSATEKINTVKIIGDVSDNSKPGQTFKLDVVDSVGNDTISDNIIAGDQSNTTLQIRPSEENKPEQSIDQNIGMEERKSIDKESKSDENKSSQNNATQKEGSATQKINTDKIIGDVSYNSEPGQKLKLNVVDLVGNDTISDSIIAGDQSNTTLQIRPSEENKPEQSMNQNIGMEERKSNGKESQSDENESKQNNDTEKEGSATEKINTDKIIGDVSDNSKPGQKFKLDVVDSVGNDTISDNIIAGDQSNTTLQIRPSEENKPEQSIDQNISMEERKSIDKESKSDENKSSQNNATQKEGSATQKINTDKIIGDVSYNSEPGQKLKLNVVDLVGNDTISDNIIAGDQSNTTLQIRPSEENKLEQSMNQNIGMEERKSNGKESQSDENKSSQNNGMEKEGSATEKINTDKIIGDVSNNSKPGQKFKLDVVDSVGNDTISDNINPDDQSNMTLQTRPSEENKLKQNIDQKEKENQSYENKSSQNVDVEKEATTTESTDSENPRSGASDNLNIGQKYKLDVVDSVGNDTISDNIIAGDQYSKTSQKKPEESLNQNNNIDTNEGNISTIHRNDSKESEIKKTTSKDSYNLLEENFDKNIHKNETFTTGTGTNDKMASDITNDENTVESVGDNVLKNVASNKTIFEKNRKSGTPDKKNKNEIRKGTEQQEKIDQSIEMKREKRETTPINRVDSNESINEKTNSENYCIETTDNFKAEICCDGIKENDNLNKTLSDTIIADNQVSTTIQKSNIEDQNHENVELKQNLVQGIDIEDKKKTELTQNGIRVAINEGGIHFEDTIIKETKNSNTEINLKHHDKNATDPTANDILNKTIFVKPLTENKQKLEQNEENLDHNKLKTGTSTDNTQEIHHKNISISDNIIEGEQINEEKCDVNQTNESSILNNYSITHSSNSAQIKCNETRDDTGNDCEKSLELIEHNNLSKAILIENSNVKQGSLTTEENESFEIKHKSEGISDQTINKEDESKLNEINCDELHTENLNIKVNTEEPMANNNIVDSSVKCCDDQKVSEPEITTNHDGLKSSKPTENPSIFCRSSNITDLKEQSSSVLTNTENETENEFDKKKSISDETNMELRQLGLITSSSDNKDGMMASGGNMSTLHEHTMNKYIKSDDSKENYSSVSTRDNSTGELDKENSRVQSNVSRVDSEFEDLSALITSNKIKEFKINDDGTISKIASEPNENIATTEQKQELSPMELFNISNDNGGDNTNSTNVTKTMENLKTSAIPTNLIMREDDLNTIGQLEFTKEVKQQSSIEKINEIDHLEIETNNCSKTNIEHNFSHNDSINSQDNNLKHTEINNNEGNSNEDLNTIGSHKSSHLNVTDKKSDEDITEIENIRETRLVSNVENDIEIQNQRQQEINTHQDNHEASSNNTLPDDDADGKEGTSDQATPLSIGNKTPKSVIGIQNFNIDRIRFYNEGLLGSISGQRFAETHLRSFWKEYIMNNSIPLGQNDNETNGIYSKQLLDSEKYKPQESYFDKNQHDEKQGTTNIEPTIVKETTKDSESIPANKQNLSPTHIINKDVERIPRYFYGAPEKLEDNKTVASKPKTYKEPLAFIIPIDDINKARTAKANAGKKLTATNSNNETHILVEDRQNYLSNNFTNLDLTFCANTEPLLEAETPPKLYEDLNQFEQRLHDVDLDITYTINEILNLKNEDDLQNNSDENDENLNDSTSDYSLTPEPMLQTIIELSESETPRLLGQSQSNNDNNIDLTAESNDDNSLISDELLKDENDKDSKNVHTHTTGGIYEYSTNEFNNVERFNVKTLHDNSHVTPSNSDTFEEVSKEISIKKEPYSENISKEEDKTIDYCNKNESDFGPSVNLHLKDEPLLVNKIVSIIPGPPNNDSLHEDLKEIAAKKIQRIYRQHLQKTAIRDNMDNLKTDDNTKAHDVESDTPVEVDTVKKEDNIDNSDKTFKDGRCSTEEIKKFYEFSKNSTSSGEQESESVSSNANSKMENLNKSTENCNECVKKGNNNDIENNNNQPLCKAETYHEQHNLNHVSPKWETSSFTGNLQSELDISANDRLSQNPILPTNDDPLHEDLKEIAAKKIQRIYRQHLQKTAIRDNRDNLETDDMELVNTTVDSFNTNFSEIDSLEGVIEIDKSDKTFKDERNSEEQDKKFCEFSKNSNNSDEKDSEPVNSDSEMKNMNNSIESSSEVYSTVANNLKMGCNSAETYHEQHNIIEKSFTRENSSITGNLQCELNATANDRSNQKPLTSEAANDNDMQVTDAVMNTAKAANIIQLFFKKYIKPKNKLQKTHWFVGDEPIIASEESPPLPKTKSEIPFDETEAYVVFTTNPSQYLVDSSSSEAIDINSFSRTPTAPITKQSNDSCSCSSNSCKDSLDEKCINLPKGSVLTDVSQPAAVNVPYIGLQSSGANRHEVNERKARYTNLIDQFITSERFYSGIVNRNYSYSDIKDIKFPSSNITEITKILTEFLDSQSERLESDIRYEILEEACIKKSVEEEISSSGSSSSSSSSDIDDAEDSLDTKTVKLQKPEIAIKKMQNRRNSTSKISSVDNLKDYNFNEPSVTSIENLDTDEEGIVVARLQRDETRESTGQSDVDVVIGSTVKENFNFESTFPSKGSLKRIYTIGGEAETKLLLKNVTIDESIKYIEPPDYELNDSSLCLDDETTANIRHKMMAYSLSEADSDVFEKTADNPDSSSWELRNKKYDDFNISTALIDNGDTSTETESTTVSAVTKIQGGTRGSFNSSKVSIGNAAISESLEHLVKEAAAKKIQKMYRQHYRLKTANANNKVKSSSECTKSIETSLAQKRSMMLQRGDALRNGSSPEEATSSSNSGESEKNGKIISKIQDTSCFKSKTLPEQESKAIYTDNATSSCSLPSSAKSAAAIRAKKIEDNKRRWIAMRQNSMPVQIDSEVLRVIPKYIRKKIKSAEGEKKKDRRRMLMD